MALPSCCFPYSNPPALFSRRPVFIFYRGEEHVQVGLAHPPFLSVFCWNIRHPPSLFSPLCSFFFFFFLCSHVSCPFLYEVGQFPVERIDITSRGSVPCLFSKFSFFFPSPLSSPSRILLADGPPIMLKPRPSYFSWYPAQHVFSSKVLPCLSSFFSHAVSICSECRPNELPPFRVATRRPRPPLVLILVRSWKALFFLAYLHQLSAAEYRHESVIDDLAECLQSGFFLLTRPPSLLFLPRSSRGPGEIPATPEADASYSAAIFLSFPFCPSLPPSSSPRRFWLRRRGRDRTGCRRTPFFACSFLGLGRSNSFAFPSFLPSPFLPRISYPL